MTNNFSGISIFNSPEVKWLFWIHEGQSLTAWSTFKSKFNKNPLKNSFWYRTRQTPAIKLEIFDCQILQTSLFVGNLILFNWLIIVRSRFSYKTIRKSVCMPKKQFNCVSTRLQCNMIVSEMVKSNIRNLNI